MEHEIDEVYEAYMADVGRDNLAKQADAAGEAARAQVEAEEVNAQEPDLREQLFEIVTDTVTTCRRCEFWDIQGKFCFLKDVRPDTVKCRLMDGIMKAMEAADWHQCPKEEWPLLNADEINDGYHLPGQDLVQAQQESDRKRCPAQQEGK